ncbi:MAG TPA: hypothetical protein VJJ47_02665 [Candidatus Paceibacterota bacterium]
MTTLDAITIAGSRSDLKIAIRAENGLFVAEISTKQSWPRHLGYKRDIPDRASAVSEIGQMLRAAAGSCRGFDGDLSHDDVRKIVEALKTRDEVASNDALRMPAAAA